MIIYFFKNLALSNNETQRSLVESSLKPMPLRPQCACFIPACAQIGELL